MLAAGSPMPLRNVSTRAGSTTGYPDGSLLSISKETTALFVIGFTTYHNCKTLCRFVWKPQNAVSCSHLTYIGGQSSMFRHTPPFVAMIELQSTDMAQLVTVWSWENCSPMDIGSYESPWCIPLYPNEYLTKSQLYPYLCYLCWWNPSFTNLNHVYSSYTP